MGGDGETATIFGTYNLKRPMPPMIIHAHDGRVPRPCGQHSEQARGGGAIFFYHDASPLPNRRLPDVRSKSGKLTSDVRCSAIVYCLTEEIKSKEDTSVDMVTIGLE